MALTPGAEPFRPDQLRETVIGSDQCDHS